MKLKHLKQKVWCNETAKCVDITTTKQVYHYDEKKQKLKVKETQPKAPSRVKCPDCGQRFKPRVRECNDAGCWHIYIPPHKKTIKVARKNQK